MSANNIIEVKGVRVMLKIQNRLRILGTHEDVLEIKAFLDQGQKDEKKILDLTKIQKAFKGEISEVAWNYDILSFVSNEPVLGVITELSTRFSEVKFALQSFSEERNENDHIVSVSIEKAHHVLLNGHVISESKSSSKHLETKKNDQVMLENKDKDQPKNDLVSKESLYDLQDKFFKDIQSFMKDFTESFFKHWF